MAMISAALEGHVYKKVAKLLSHLRAYFGSEVSLEELLLACEVVARWSEGQHPTISELANSCGVPLSRVVDDPLDDRKKRIAPPAERRQQLAQQLLLIGLIATPSTLDAK
jgi:hypothetical protein